VKKNPSEIIEYKITLGVERGNTDERIIIYTENDTVFGDYSSRKYLDQITTSNEIFIPEYYDIYGGKRIKISEAQMDSLTAFEQMLLNDDIRHNQGLKMAGRMGNYEIMKNDTMITRKSRNLFSLLQTLNLKK
jgi:hypothetical protein